MSAVLHRVTVAIALLATVMTPAAKAAGSAGATPATTATAGRSTAPGEQTPAPAGRPRFAVSVRPSAARPGDTVAVTFSSPAAGVEIIDCIAFFPQTAGSTCHGSPQLRVARTRVPENLPPGPTLLHWGVESVSATGRHGASDDVIPFLVLSPAPAAGTTTAPPGESAPSAPAFEVVAGPAAAAGGKQRRDTAWGLFWPAALGGLLLAGLLGLRVVRRPIRNRLRPHPDTPIAVLPVPAPEEMVVEVDRPDARPARDIRLEIRRPRLAPQVPEDLP